MKHIKIGYVLTSHKVHALRFHEINGTIFDNKHIELIKIDPDLPLHLQQKCDLIFHKIHDYYTDDLLMTDASAILEKINKFAFEALTWCIPLIDPWDSILKIQYRTDTANLLKSCECEINGYSFKTPVTIDISSSHTDETLLKKMRENGLTFPLIIKPAGGVAAKFRYEMSLHFGKSDRFSQICDQFIDYIPCTAQQFHNHDGILYKLYVIGKSWHVTPRPSLINQDFSQTEPLYFKSNAISKKRGQSDLASDPDISLFPNDKSAGLCSALIDEFLKRFRSKIEINCFGADIIVDASTKTYYVVDINYLPGYKGVPNASDLFLKLLCNYC